MKRQFARLLAELAGRHGPQGWWPIRSERHLFANDTDPRQHRGYHPGELDFPRTRQGRWEIVMGAVLTQNTAWTNVERALDALADARVTAPETLLDLEPTELGALIRPAGYFNQKSRYLRAVGEWFLEQDEDLTTGPRSRATVQTARPRLLAVRGVGRETADSILLYAYRLPTFVIDAYTRRVLEGRDLIAAAAPYEQLRSLCEGVFWRSTDARRVEVWQEAHALFVEEAKSLRRGRTTRSGHSPSGSATNRTRDQRDGPPLSR